MDFFRHTYGLYLPWPLGPGEEYEIYPPFGNLASGFDVKGLVFGQKEIYPYNKETGEGGICFMGSEARKNSFYFDILERMPIWIDDECYEALFEKFLIDKTDPEVLLISGLIFDDGGIELKRMYMMEEGIIDEDIIPGNYSIEISDINGELLTNIPFSVSFKTYTDPETNTKRGVSGFAFVIPYPEATSKIQIQYDGEILIKINPNTKLLHDAVDLIPNYGFINNPRQRRNALHNKINEVEIKIENNEIQDAINKLKFDIKDKFEKWLIDDYQKESIEQLSKIEVINLTQTIIDRLSNQ